MSSAAAMSRPGPANRRDQTFAARPGGISKIYLCGDSALYQRELMRWLDEQAIGCAISADMCRQLAECITALPEDHGKLDREETDAIRMGRGQLPAWRWHLAQGSGLAAPLLRHSHPPAPGCAAARWQPRASLLHCHQPSNADGGSGRDLIRWHRQKAETIGHAHDVLVNELAGAGLPS